MKSLAAIALALLLPLAAVAQSLDGLPPVGVSPAPALSGADIVPVCQGGRPGVPGTCTVRRTTVAGLTQGSTLNGNLFGVGGMAGDELNLTKNYTEPLVGSPHQQVNNANITVPVTTEIWNNFDDVNWNMPGGDTSPIGGHVVARYTQIRKAMDSPNVPAMGLIVGVVDFTGHASNTSGPIVSFELDQEVSGPDNHSGAFGPNGSRVMLSLLAQRGRSYVGTDTTINAAMAVFGDTNVLNFKRVLNVAAGWTFAAIDLTPGVQIGSAVTIAMNPGMRIAFAPSRHMYWDAAAFGAAGGFHLTGKVQADELLYAPAGFTAGNTIALGGNTTIGTSATSTLGFYGATAVVKPTGVAVTAAGVHAALTSLGLIAP